MINLNSPLKPDLNKLHSYLERVNESGWFTNFGPLHNELTHRLEDFLGVKNLLLVNNGTLALQVAAKALETKSILATPFSFVATISAFKWQKDDVAFADVDRETYNLSPQAIKNAIANNCKADTLVATHVYGNPCDVVAIDTLAQKFNMKTIYDAAHAFGIKVHDQSVLKYGDASILSFHATKVFHTIEGGAVVFKQKQHFEKAKQLINFGINSNGVISGDGINAKLNEYQAAVGLVNIKNIDNILYRRAELFTKYSGLLKSIVEIPTWHASANINGAYFVIALKNKTQRDKLVIDLNKKSIQSRCYFSPSLDEIYKNIKSYGIENSRHIADRVLCLPLHAYMTDADVELVVNTIKESVK
tara:strand:+ start:4796 stop:5875 length:1080 start_codon:yes stop_codon:yes gene_type:complete